MKSGTKSATSIPESIQSDESETWNKSIGSRTNSNKVDGNDASQLNGSVTAENMAYDELDGEDAADEPGVGLKKTLISYIRRNNRIRLDSELDWYVQDEKKHIEAPTEELEGAPIEHTFDVTADLSEQADSDESGAHQPEEEDFVQPGVNAHIKIVSKTIVNAHLSDWNQSNQGWTITYRAIRCFVETIEHREHQHSYIFIPQFSLNSREQWVWIISLVNGSKMTLLYLRNGENESSRQWIGRTQRFERRMIHTRCSREWKLN